MQPVRGSCVRAMVAIRLSDFRGMQRRPLTPYALSEPSAVSAVKRRRSAGHERAWWYDADLSGLTWLARKVVNQRQPIALRRAIIQRPLCMHCMHDAAHHHEAHRPWISPSRRRISAIAISFMTAKLAMPLRTLGKPAIPRAEAAAPGVISVIGDRCDGPAVLRCCLRSHASGLEVCSYRLPRHDAVACLLVLL